MTTNVETIAAEHRCGCPVCWAACRVLAASAHEPTRLRYWRARAALEAAGRKLVRDGMSAEPAYRKARARVRLIRSELRALGARP